MQPNKIRVQYLSRKDNALESENANRKINELVRIFYYSLLFGLSFFTFPLQAKIAITANLDPFSDPFLEISPYGTGDYLQHKESISHADIHLILEIGSRDAIDAIRLGYFYQCPVYAFECHPQSIPICLRHAEQYPFVHIEPYACWNQTTWIPFYPVVLSHEGNFPVNMGGSSLLVTRPDGLDAHHKQGSPVMVQAIRLDEWLKLHEILQVDLLCMDCQGATLQVLEGLGEAISKIKYIISEVYFRPAFEGESLFPEILAFLEERGFELQTPLLPPEQRSFSDLLFVNKRLVSESGRVIN